MDRNVVWGSLRSGPEKLCMCLGCVAGVRSEPESGANSVGQASGEEWKVGVRGWRQAFKTNKIG